MSFIEQAVAELNQITTLRQLECHLANFASWPNIDWCCFIVHNSSTAYIGDAPDSVKQQLSLPVLKKLNQHCCKPCWSGADVLADLALPPASLLVPIAASHSEHAFMILGYTRQNIEPKLAEKLGWFWQVIAIYVYDIYRRVSGTSVAISFQLTPRELECIHWAANGKTSWEISRILGITERTVNFHLGNSMQKTGSNNRQQLIRNCMNII